MANKDYLWLNLRELPYFRGALRAVEGSFYEQFGLKKPVLDLGCGDGQFAEITFDQRMEVGIDPWLEPLREAKKRDAYNHVIMNEGVILPFSNSYFATVISNSVLEHIQHLPPVLEEVVRVLKPGGQFLFCVPNHQFLNNLSIGKFLDRFGLKKLANSYRAWFNKISRHYHCNSPEVWKQWLNEAGFDLERWWHYYSPKSLAMLEWGHYFGLPSLIIHRITGRWILVPTKWNLWLTRKIVEKSYGENTFSDPNGAYTFYVARRKA
jgi:SAM-dependent methyltransferase